MRAAVFYGPDHMELADLPLPQPGPGDALLRVRACAVCGTDLRILAGGKTRGVRPPRVLGHEVAAEVVELATGAAVSGGLPVLRLGQRVTVVPGFPCGACRYCLTGAENLCRHRPAIGYSYDGGFADYMLVPARGVARGHVLPVPAELPDEIVALAEPLACCVNGMRKSQVHLGDVVAIAGAGPIGLMHLALVRAAGAAKVIVSEPNAERREQARARGASVVIDPTVSDPVQALRDESGGEGVDVAVLAIGVPDLIQQMLRAVRPGGRVNLFAGYAAMGEATIEANLIHYGEVVVTGTSASTREDFRIALALLDSGQLDLSGLVTHRYPLERVHEAFDTTRRGDGLRVVVEPTSLSS